jgi:hypothetical protein
MKSSKFQAPTSREIPMTKHQTRIPVGCETPARLWSLKLGASLVLGCWCLVLLLCPNAHAQSYSIDWFTIDGGGGTSTGGVYSVSGTIGQPDASSAMTGGNYSVTGGFWSLFAVQTPGAPTLRIFLTTTNTAVVAWPAPSIGWTLKSNTNLVTTNWSGVTNAVNVVGSENQVVISPPAGNKYFRLSNP